MNQNEFDKKGKLDELQRQRMLETLQEKFDRLDDTCGPYTEEMFPSATFEWTAKGIGFGSFTFYLKPDGKLHCDNETMGKDFIKKMLCKMVDECVLDHPEPKEGKDNG